MFARASGRTINTWRTSVVAVVRAVVPKVACGCEGSPQERGRQPHPQCSGSNSLATARARRPPCGGHDMGFEVGGLGQTARRWHEVSWSLNPASLEAGEECSETMLVPVCEQRPRESERTGKTRKGAGDCHCSGSRSVRHAVCIQTKTRERRTGLSAGNTSDCPSQSTQKPGEEDFATDAASPVVEVLQIRVLQQRMGTILKVADCRMMLVVFSIECGT